MKSLCFMLSLVLLSSATVGFAQTDAKKPVVQSDAQKSFDTIKTLAGVWTAKLTLDPPMPGMNDKETPG